MFNNNFNIENPNTTKTDLIDGLERFVDGSGECVHAVDGGGRGDSVSQIGDVSVLAEFASHVDGHLPDLFLKTSAIKERSRFDVCKVFVYLGLVQILRIQVSLERYVRTDVRSRLFRIHRPIDSNYIVSHRRLQF